MRSAALLASYILCLFSNSLFGQTGLPFRVIDAEFSTALNRIVMISEGPDQLHIYDPVTGVDKTVGLPKAPTDVSVGPDGQFAGVAFDSLIGYVDLSAAALVATYPVSGPVIGLVLAKDYIHLELQSNGVRSIQLAGGAILSPGNYSGGLAQGRLHPAGKGIYLSGGSNGWRKFDVSSGPITNTVDPVYPSDSQSCGKTWISADGARLYSGCGTVAAVSVATPQLDMRYVSTLAGVTRVSGITDSSSLQRVAVIPSVEYNSSSSVVDNEIVLYHLGTLERIGVLRLSDYVLGGRNFVAHGRWTFFDAAGTVLYVVMQADSTSGLLNDFSILTFDLANPALCVPVLTPASSISVAWNGTTGTVEVAAPGSCQVASVSNAEWLQVVQSSLRSGAGSVRYQVRANLSNQSRTATLTIGGQAVTVTQDPAPAVIPATAQLSFPVVDAEYSAALDRVVLVSAGPNELHLFSPVTWQDQVVPLAKAPMSVSLRPDGLSAAVGHDGWVSIVNLQTGRVESFLESMSQAGDILYDPSGFVYPMTSRYGYATYPLDTATGKWTYVPSFTLGRLARLHPGGVYTYAGEYSLSKWTLANGVMKQVPLSNYGYNCGNFWYSQDGLRIFTRCGTVLRSSSSLAQDLAENGSFAAGGSGLQADWVDHSAPLGTIAVLSNEYYSATPANLRLFGSEFLGLSSVRPLPKVRVGTSDVQTYGRYVFWSSAANRLYMFTRLNPEDRSISVVNDTFVTLVEENIGKGGCTVTLSGGTGTIAGAGDSGSVTVSAGDACAWTAVSSASWVRITAGGFGLGSGSVLFAAEKNPYGLARTATITVSGQPVTITQAAGAAVTAPALVGANPANPALASTAVAFTVRDLDGAANISRVYFQIGATSVVSTNGCHGFYDRATSGLYLYNDALTALQGPLTPGATGILENGQCRLNAAASAVSAAGTDLVLTLGLELKGSYLTGAWNMYLWTQDAQGNGTGWVKTGTWTVAPTTNLVPAVVPGGVTLTGASQAVVMQARDGNGSADLSRIYFVVNSTAGVPVNGCHGFYDRASNRLYLYNDALTALTGPLTPGAIGTLQNSQCAIDGAGTTVTLPSSTDVVVTLAMRMQGAFTTGTRNVYVWAQDKQSNDTGWVQTATWTMTPANVPPAIVSGTPTEVTATTQTLNFTVRDGDGYTNLSRVYFLINPTIGIPSNTCHGYYERANHSFYLYSDGLSALAGPAVAGSAGTLQNGQCQISAGNSPVTGNGTDLLMSLNVTVRGTFAGTALRVALWAVDAQGNGTGWVQTGTWTAGVTGGPVAPTLVGVTPSPARGTSQIFTVTARDINGQADISRIYFQLHSSAAVVVNTCHGFYDRGLNAVYLYNDALTALIGPLNAGAATSISNGQCSVDGAALSASGSGSDFALTLPVTLKGSYLNGSRILYFWVVDQASLGTGWQYGPTWSAGTAQAPEFSNYMGYAVSGPVQAVTVYTRDVDGVGDLNRIYFQLHTSPTVVANSCHGFYERATNSIFLYNDSLTALVPGSTRPGVNSTVANSQCSINGAASSVTVGTNDLTLTLMMTRLGTFATTTKNLYWWVVDNGGLGTGWVLGLNWAP